MTRSPWTDADDTILRTRYPHEPTVTLAADLGRTTQAVSTRASVLGLSKTPEARAKIVRETPGVRFPYQGGNGHRRNTSGMREYQFKPGNRPWHQRPIGTVLPRGGGNGYLYRKVSETGVRNVDWRPVHLLVWEAVHGPIEPGHALIFRDGNRMNTAIENLELVTRAELMRRNSVRNLPPEIADTIKMRGILNRMINQRTKRAAETNT